MGINYKSMDKKKRVTLAEVGELYAPGGCKFTCCRCNRTAHCLPLVNVSSSISLATHIVMEGKEKMFSAKIVRLWRGSKKILFHNYNKEKKRLWYK
jgi:hypothetical protein